MPERVTWYRDAKARYEVYLREHHPAGYLMLTDADHQLARADRSLVEAEAAYRRAIELTRELDVEAEGDLAVALYQLGMLYHLQGRLAEAKSAFVESSRTMATVPVPEPRATSGVEYHLGLLALREGSLAEARRLLRNALSIDTLVGDEPAIALDRAALERVGEVTGEAVAVEEMLPDTEKVDEAEKRDEELEQAAAQTVRDSGLTEVIWLLSYSAEANEELMKQLRQLGGAVHRPVVISRAALAFGTQQGPAPLASDQRLAGAVLIVEPQGLENDDFRFWARHCIDMVALHADFRLFVYSPAAAVDELLLALQERGEHDAADLLRTLRETVQTTKLDPPAIVKRLAAHLQRVDDIRDAISWRDARTNALTLLGRAAAMVQIAAGIVSAAIAAVLLVARNSPLAQLAGEHAAAVGLAVGILSFSAWVPFLYLMARQRPESDSTLERYLPSAAFVVLGVSVLGSRLAIPAAWSTLGMGIGVMLDAIRRAGLDAARRRPWQRNVLRDVRDPDIATRLADEARRGVSPFECPMLPSEKVKTFISYGRGQELAWSRRQAALLHERLTTAGGSAFLDTASVDVGSNWRSAIERSVAEADLFIAIVESETTRHEWVAAEWMMALRGRALFAHPQIVIVRHPDVVVDGESLPVFAAVVERARDEASAAQPRIIVGDDGVLSVLPSLTRLDAFRAPTLFHPKLRRLLEWLSGPVMMVGALAPVVGVVAPFLCYFEYWEKSHIGDWLATRALLPWAFLLTALWLGVMLRFAATSRYEAERPHPVGMARMHLFGALGFCGFVGLWASRVPPLFAGWGVVVVPTAWLLAAVYFDVVTRVRPDLRRSI